MADGVERERLPGIGEDKAWSIEFNKKMECKWVYHNCEPWEGDTSDPFGGLPNEDNSKCLNCGTKIPVGIANFCKLMNTRL